MLKKIRFILCALAAALLLPAAFSGCGGTLNSVVNISDTSEGLTTITFFGNKYEPENVAVIESIISGFMADNPEIRVSYESLKGAEYYEVLEKRIAAGKGDDVFMVNHDMVLKLESGGSLADLSALSTLSSYTPRMKSQMGGVPYWVPTTVSVFGLYCNMDLLQEHRQEVPQNLAQWEDVCGYFAEQGITPVIANNDISLKTLAIGVGFFSAYQENRQARVFDRLNQGEEKLSGYLSPGFSLAEKWLDLGFIDAAEALETKKTADDLTEFVKGEAPFMLTGAWAANRVLNMEPGFSFTVQPLPFLEDGSFLVINADTRLSVNADSAHLEAAMKFVEYFTQKENIQRFTDDQCSFSPLQDGNPSSVTEIHPLISCYESGRTVMGADELLELPIWELTAEVSKKLLSGEPLESAMAWMDEQAAGKGEG